MDGIVCKIGSIPTHPTIPIPRFSVSAACCARHMVRNGCPEVVCKSVLGLVGVL